VAEVVPGILAIWNDCAPGREAGFEKWYQHEHLAERIAVPGFLVGRRLEAVGKARPRYFGFYVMQSPEVLFSAAYLQRLNNPTPMTRLVMTEIFRNMIRTVCRRSLRLGAMRGAVSVTARFGARADEAALRRVLEKLMQDKAVACGEIWTAVPIPAGPATEEERLRGGGDYRIETCMVVDVLCEADATGVAEILGSRFPTAIVGAYRLLCEVRAPAAARSAAMPASAARPAPP
jgi:hypothetical protein